jgi:hypothetical protein
MKRLYLHIGLGKTGSSALQSWLSLNTQKLAKQGKDYADLVPVAKLGKPTSGNGQALISAIHANHYEEVERLLSKVYFFSRKNHAAIVSSELLKDVGQPDLQKIKDICCRHDIEITVIAFIRSVYERAYSAYAQEVKVAGKTADIRKIFIFEHWSDTMKNLRKYKDLFGDDMILLNYDDPGRDIYTAFAASTGIDITVTDTPNIRVNRSLSFEELNAQRLINGLHNGRFSAAISSYLISLSPNKVTSIYYNEVLVNRTRRHTEADIHWINQEFNLHPPLAADFYTGQSADNGRESIGDILQVIASWALSYSPEESLRLEFSDFLDKFSASLIEHSIENGHLVAARARIFGN